MALKPYTVAKPFYLGEKNYLPGQVIYLDDKEAAHLAFCRVIGAPIRRTVIVGDQEVETGTTVQPERRRGRPSATGKVRG